MRHRIHVIKVPTTNPGLFPYSHYADMGHDPYLEVIWEEPYLFLRCHDLFKLKPNVQMSPKNRIDIYIPYSSAREIGGEIAAAAGAGRLAPNAGADPELYRVGAQTLPLIDASKRVSFRSADVEIAGFEIHQDRGRVFLDRERPNEGHIEMAGPEVHFGFHLSDCTIQGRRDATEITRVSVPPNELRTGNERNPIEKAYGTVLVAFDADNARALAGTLLFFAAQQ